VGLIAAGQDLDRLYLVAQFGEVSMMAQAMQRSASPSIITCSVVHCSAPGSRRTASHIQVGSLPCPSACFQSVGFGSFRKVAAYGGNVGLPPEREDVGSFHRDVQVGEFTAPDRYNGFYHLDGTVRDFAAGRYAGVAAVERYMD